MLGQLIGGIIRQGTVVVVGPRGASQTYGAGLPKVTVRLHDGAAFAELGLHPDLKLGELYMDGRLRSRKAILPS